MEVFAILKEVDLRALRAELGGFEQADLRAQDIFGEVFHDDGGRAVRELDDCSGGIGTDDMHEVIDEVAVELGVRLCDDVFDGLVRQPRAAIAALGGERIVDVRHRKNAAEHRDAGALVAVRVAGPVDLFVVGLHALQHLVRDVEALAQALDALFRVRLDDGELAVRHRTVFVDDLDRNVNLANVVHQRAQADVLEPVARDAHFVGQQDREDADVETVGIGITVVALDLHDVDEVFVAPEDLIDDVLGNLFRGLDRLVGDGGPGEVVRIERAELVCDLLADLWLHDAGRLNVLAASKLDIDPVDSVLPQLLDEGRRENLAALEQGKIADRRRDALCQFHPGLRVIQRDVDQSEELLSRLSGGLRRDRVSKTGLLLVISDIITDKFTACKRKNKFC